jgi:hypothetical protein
MTTRAFILQTLLHMSQHTTRDWGPYSCPLAFNNATPAEKTMTRRAQPFILAACAVALLPLIGCSDEPEVAKSKPAEAAPASPVASAGNVSALEPRYEASLAEGIDFTKPGYPSFLKEVSGMAGYEPWGRWTDANAGPAARFRFAQPLPKRVTLELQAHGLLNNAYRPVRVRIGANEKSITLGNPPKEKYEIEFEDTGGADTIEIIPPEPILPRVVTPGNNDTRRLGVGLKSLRIRG